MTCLKQGIKAVKLTSVMRAFPDAGTSPYCSGLSFSLKTIFLDTLIFLVSLSQYRIAFDPSSKPTNTIFFDLGSSFDLFLVSSKTQTSQPNSLKWLTSGFFPVQASYGVMPFRARVGARFRR